MAKLLVLTNTEEAFRNLHADYIARGFTTYQHTAEGPPPWLHVAGFIEEAGDKVWISTYETMSRSPIELGFIDETLLFDTTTACPARLKVAQAHAKARKVTVRT